MIAQLAVHFAQDGGVESRAAEISVDGRVAAQKLAHVGIVNLLEIPVATAVGCVCLIRVLLLRRLLDASGRPDECGHA